MKTIILPTDFSETAHSAMDYAIGMFSYESVKYILLNVYTEPPSNSDMLVTVNDLMEKASKRGLIADYEYLSKKYPGDLLNVELRSEYGGLSAVINRFCQEEEIDYVVMGTKGASGIKKLWGGSNTATVVSHVLCPVLAVPAAAEYKPPIRIAFTTDHEDLEQQEILEPLVELVEQYQSELLVVNIRPELADVNTENGVSGIRLNNILDRIPHQYYGSQHEDVVKGIGQFVQENKVGMLAMVARQHHLLDRLFHQSVTKQMSMLSDIPLLILHER